MRYFTKYLIRLLLFFVIVMNFKISNFNTYAETETVVTTVSVSDVTIQQGSSQYVDVDISGVVNIASLSVDIYYDATKFDVSSVNVGEFSNSSTYSFNYDEDGHIRFNAVAPDGITQDGNIFSFYLNVNPSVETGTYPIQVAIGEVYDSNLNPVSVSSNYGRVIVTEVPTYTKNISINQSISNTNLQQGDSFSYEVSSYDLKDLSGGNFELYYDRDLLELDLVDVSSYMAKSDAIYSVNDSNPGYVKMTYASVAGLNSANPMITYHFTVKADVESSSMLIFSTNSLIDSNLSSMTSNTLSQTIQITKIPEVVTYPSIYITDFHGSNESSFSVIVNIDENSGLAAGDFQLNYDSSKVIATNIEISDSVSTNGGILSFNPTFDNGTISFSYINMNGLYLSQSFIEITFEPVVPGEDVNTNLSMTGTNLINEELDNINLDFSSTNSILLEDYYSIEFVDYDNTTIKTYSLPYGASIIAPQDPNREGTIFSGWDKEFSTVTEDSVIKAIYSLDYNSISFNQLDTIYNGEEQSVNMSGLPQGASATYINNDKIDTGEYTVQAKLYLDGIEQSSLYTIMNIFPKDVEVSIDNHTSVYGEENLNYSYNISGLILGDELGLSIFSIDNYNVGVHTLSASITNPNYNLNVLEGDLTITKASYDMSGITFNDSSFVYDSTSQSIGVSGSLPEGVSVSYVNNGQTEVGNYTITAKFSGDSTNYYAIPDMTATLSITKANLTVTAEDQTSVYGESEASLTYTVSGTNYNNEVAISLERETGNTVGTYEISVSASDSNYNITLVNGTYTITKASYDMSGITFNDSSFVYDSTSQSIGVSGSLPEGVSVSYVNNGQTEVGNYTITAKFSGDSTNYYAIPDMTATLSITKANLTVTAEDQTSVYGESEASLTYTVSGTNYNNEVAISLERETGNTVGTYEISVSASDSNYNITLVNGTYTITKASYDMSGITFNDSSFVYDSTSQSIGVSGSLLEGVSVSYVNNGQTEVGNYTITAKFSGDSTNYYAIPDMTATLSITKANLTVTAEDQTSVYGESEASLTYTVSGTNYNNEVAISLERETGNTVGTYEISVSASDSNYNITLVNGTYTITKASYDMSGITFNDSSFVYDSTSQSIGVSGSLPEGVSVSYVNNGQTEVGNYTITAKFSGDSTNYYAIPDMTATLSITKANLTVTAEDQTSVYGESEASLTYTVSGTNYNNEVAISLERETGNTVGTYEISVSASDSNYNITLVNGTYTITKASYDMSGITFNDSSFVYDSTSQSIGVSGSLPEGVSVSYVNNGQTEVGNYTITAKFSGDSTNYYAIPDMTATLTIHNDIIAPTFDIIPDQIIEAGITNIDWTTYIENAQDNSEGTLVFLETGDLIDYNKIGSYTVSVKVADQYGNETSQTFNVTVEDTTAPTFDLSMTSIEVGEYDNIDWIQYIINIIENTDGNTSLVEVQDLVDYNRLGTYIVTLKIVDESGNENIQDFHIDVEDTIAPTFSLILEDTIEAGEDDIDWSNYVRYASDNTSSELFIEEYRDYIDYDTPGEYRVIIRVSDESGNSTEKEIIVTVEDNTRPTFDDITTQTIEAGQYTNYDWTRLIENALDNSDSRLALDEVLDGVDYNTAGRYRVKVSATDESNNVREVSFYVVVEDTEPPSFYISNQTIEAGEYNSLESFIRSSSDNSDDELRYSEPNIRVDYNTAGTYQVTIRLSDSSGNYTDRDITVIVRDTIAPTFDTIGTQTIETGIDDIDWITYIKNASDNSNSRLQLIEVSDGVNYNTIGTYTVTVKVVDDSNNETNETFTVNLIEQEDPSFDTISDQTIEADTENIDWTNYITNIRDNSEGILTKIETNDTVDYDSPGTYQVTVTLRDQSYHETSKTFNVTVEDTTPPTFDTISDQIIEAGIEDIDWTSYIINAADNSDNVLTSVEVLDSIDYNTPGIYNVTVRLIDESENHRDQEFIVTVEDTTAPTFTTIQDQTIEATVTDMDWTRNISDIQDNSDTKLTLVEIEDTIIYDLPGSYSVTLAVRDLYNNETKVTFNVTVIDTQGPTITNISSIDYELTELIPDYFNGVNAIDIVDGNVTESLKIDDSAVDYETLGSYLVIYTATDSKGNVTQVERVINVVDTNAPKLTLNPMLSTVPVNAILEETGVTISDLSDTTLIIESDLDLTTVGTYIITYIVTDTSGNVSEIDRIIHVYEPEPEVQFHLEDSLTTIEVGSTYEDPSCTATINGESFNCSIEENTADTNIAGVYTVTYSVEYDGETYTHNRYVFVYDVSDNGEQTLYYRKEEEVGVIL